MARRTRSGRSLDAQMRAAVAAVAATGVALALGALAVFGPSIAFSVAVGAAIAAANLWALARIVAALLPAGEAQDGPGGPGTDTPGAGGGATHEPEGGSGAWALVGVLKMFGLFAVVWLLMHYGVVSPLPMVVGFGALPIGIAIGSLVSNRGPAREEDD